MFVAIKCSFPQIKLIPPNKEEKLETIQDNANYLQNYFMPRGWNAIFLSQLCCAKYGMKAFNTQHQSLYLAMIQIMEF